MSLLKNSSRFLSSTALALILCLGIPEVRAMEGEKNWSSLRSFTDINPLSIGFYRTDEEFLTDMLATAGKFYEHEMMTRYPLTPEGHMALFAAVERGDDDAQDELMRRYEKNLFTDKDVERHIDNFMTWTNIEDRLTSKPGYAKAYYKRYKARAFDKIKQNIKNAALAGDAQAIYNQAIIRTPNELYDYYREAVKNGSLVSIQAGEVHLTFGKRTDWEYKCGLYYLEIPDSDTLIRRAALTGDLIAQLEVAKVLVERKNESTRQKAVDLLRLHAAKGNRDALFMLGRIAIYDDPEAEDRGILYMMGKFYGEGEDRSKVFAESVQMLLQAYNLGHPEAGVALSHLYSRIKDSQLEESFKKGAYQVIFPIYRQLADEDEGLFQAILGQMLEYGDYVDSNYVEALTLYKKAVENPSTDISDLQELYYKIAKAHELGMGVEKDLDQAFEWYVNAHSSEANVQIQKYITGKPVTKESKEEKALTNKIHSDFVGLEKIKLAGTPNLGSVTLNSSAPCFIPHFAETFSKFKEAESHLLALSHSKDFYLCKFLLLTEIEAKEAVPGHIATHTLENVMYVTIGETNCRLAEQVMTTLKSFVEIEPALLRLISSCQKAIEGFDVKLLQLSAIINAKPIDTEVDPLEAKLIAKAKAKAKASSKLKLAAREALVPDHERLVRYRDTSDKLRNYVTTGARARNDEFFNSGFEFLRQ